MRTALATSQSVLRRGLNSAGPAQVLPKGRSIDDMVD
jgi:hypothetical protein